MTAAATHPRRARARQAEPDPPAIVRWEKIGVIAGLAFNLVLGAMAFAKLQADVATLREEVPPGVIQRLDERTVQIQKSLDQLSGKR